VQYLVICLPGKTYSTHIDFFLPGNHCIGFHYQFPCEQGSDIKFSAILLVSKWSIFQINVFPIASRKYTYIMDVWFVLVVTMAWTAKHKITADQQDLWLQDSNNQRWYLSISSFYSHLLMQQHLSIISSSWLTLIHQNVCATLKLFFNIFNLLCKCT
jgi:hypothetical protein